MLVACTRCTAQVIWSIFPHQSREDACPFLSEGVSDSIAHQDLRCHRKVVNIFGCDMGFAPRNLDRSLMFRQGSSLFKTCTHVFAVRIDVNGPNRLFDQEDDCKELSHWHSSIVKCDWSICSCAQLGICCDRAETPTNLTTAWIGMQFGTIGEILFGPKLFRTISAVFGII